MSFSSSTSLYRSFLQSASECAGQPSITFLDAELNPTAWSYAELFDRVEQLGRQVDASGISAGRVVGILLESQAAQVLHYLALLSRGLTPAILTPPNRKLSREYYLHTTRSVLEYCRFAAVITSLELGPAIPVLQPFTLAGASPAAAGVMSQSAPGVFIQFSSGTTGIKRGVVLHDREVMAQIAAYSKAIGLTRNDRIISWLPLYHDMGFIACLNMALACGVHSVMMQPLDWVANPAMFLRAVSQYQGTLSWNPNFAYMFMADRCGAADLGGLDLSSVRGLVNCSEPVTQLSQTRFIERFAACGLRQDVFWGCYAMAETTFAVTHGSSADPGYRDEAGPSNVFASPYSKPFLSVGRPMEGVELNVTDDAGNRCGDREVGEVRVKSPFNLKEYYNNTEATENAFAGEWLRTGDLGYTVGPELFVVGRQKDMIIVGGVNVYPQDIESLVSEVSLVHPGRVAAFSDFDSASQTEKVTILAESDVSSSDRIQLLTTIRQRVLAAFQIMNFDVHLVAPGWLTKSSSGKVARRANRERWRQYKGEV